MKLSSGRILFYSYADLEKMKFSSFRCIIPPFFLVHYILSSYFVYTVIGALCNKLKIFSCHFVISSKQSFSISNSSVTSDTNSLFILFFTTPHLFFSFYHLNLSNLLSGSDQNYVRVQQSNLAHLYFSNL